VKLSKTCLSVGGGPKNTQLPGIFEGFEVKILDINPELNPDVCMDARKLAKWEGEKFDDVYSSHNLEHFRQTEVLQVLDGIYHVLKDDGIFVVVVPDAKGIMEWMVKNDYDLDQVVYEVMRGPITVRDMIYGHAGTIRKQDNEWMLHKTGFSARLLSHALYDAGFPTVMVEATGKEIVAIAWKKEQEYLPELDLTTKNRLEKDYTKE
jgi:predicted SAM-dependent methyltransferase